MLREFLRRLGLQPKRERAGPEPRGTEPVAPEPTRRDLVRIMVELPPDREEPGTLVSFEETGRLVSGPWPAIGKADPALAAARGNPSCDRLRRFGDTPTGTYHLLDRLPPSSDARVASQVGPHGVLVFRPVSGEAAEADANGRTTLLIHGGEDYLAATDGSICVPNEAMAEIMALVPADPAALQRVRVDVADGADTAGWKDSDESAGSSARLAWLRRSRQPSSSASCDVRYGESNDDWDFWLHYQNQFAVLNALDCSLSPGLRKLPAGQSEQDRDTATALEAAGFDVLPELPSETAPGLPPSIAGVASTASDATSAPAGSPDQATTGTEVSQSSGGAYDR